VRDPQVFLLDEPLSNLDAKLRAHMRAELIELHRRLGKTMVYVTHDQLEAMTMSTRIAVMRGGTLQQFATPEEIYRHPANSFVAGFIGTPSMSLCDGQLLTHDDLARSA
jgi:multiple sugar transport system ATP-binding protein